RRDLTQPCDTAVFALVSVQRRVSWLIPDPAVRIVTVKRGAVTHLGSRNHRVTPCNSVFNGSGMQPKKEAWKQTQSGRCASYRSARFIYKTPLTRRLECKCTALLASIFLRLHQT